MPYDIEMVREFYAGLCNKVNHARKAAGRPLTLAEKVLFVHLYHGLNGQQDSDVPQRGSYAAFRPDRVAMQDATAQMAVLQFMNAGRDAVAVPSTIHCDHLICARDGVAADLPEAMKANAEVYGFLQAAAARYGIGSWKPGAGIIHQVVLENYAFPGGMMVGTDSHPPNAGGLGMLAIGVGGADAVDVMSGMEWELKVPKIIGVHLTGQLGDWASPKDVILHLAGLLTVKGGTNAIIEYFGEGAESLSCTGKATICNMGAEVGATCSVFPYDSKMAGYLEATGRGEIAALASAAASCLRSDPEVAADPQKYYDRVIEIDLGSLEPYVNGPFTPDAACPMSRMKKRVKEMGYPEEVQVSLIGSCTNSSYQDLARAASVARHFLESGCKPVAGLIINPGSERIRATAERDGILGTLKEAGAVIMTNACGPCIGQWKRKTDDPSARNSIVTSFNRNFAKRADGNPNTHAFIVSPEVAVALAFIGRLYFDPSAFPAPEGPELPSDGFADCESGYIAPVAGSPAPVINPDSERLQLLKPFEAWDGRDFTGAALLIKTTGKCTTDHISMAGPWLKFRGHLENISNNLLMGAVNAFSGKTNAVSCGGAVVPVSEAARTYRDHGRGSVVVAEDNYGEGSSREHAAMEPRFLGVKAVIAKSFARIHETNLKKQGVLALTFADPADYALVREGDSFDIHCADIAPGSKVQVELHHADGSCDSFTALHSYNGQQIGWLRAGSALNSLKAAGSAGTGSADAMEVRTVPFVQGDGVGPEVTAAMRKVLDAAVSKAYGGTRKIEWLEVLAGGKAFEKLGTYLPDETMEAFRKYGIGIKGPLMTPVGGGIRSLNVALRQGLDLYVCQRPVRWFKGIVSPVKHPERVDMVIFRENTEDIYAGIEWEAGTPEAARFYEFLRDEMGVTKVRFPQTSSFGVKPVSKEGTERLVTAACKYALEHGRPSVTLVHKGNIMKFTEGGFKKWGYEVAQREFGDAIADGRLVIKDCIADAFLQNALLKPEDYSVIATLNLNGDYISDMLAAQVGGIGIAPGANINYSTGSAIFEATHGTAPDIAGKDIVNPCSNILSGVMMLEHIGWKEAGALVEAALEESFAEGYATTDLARLMPDGKALGTAAFAEHIVGLIKK